MATDSRQEYVPGRRAASAGRTRPLSASFYPAGDSSASLFSSTPAGGFRPSRPLSAVGNRSVQSPGWAWGSPSEGGHGSGLLAESSAPKRVHVQALAGAKGREQLAEDVVTLREQVSKLKSHLGSQTVEKRRVEQELLRTKSSLLKAEELLNSKERSIGSPNMGISQLYRSPDTTHLVGNLKQQVAEHKASASRLESELRALQRSSRATKVSELQSELFAMTGEVERLSRLNQQSNKRMQDAEAAAKQALADAAQVRALAMQQQAADGRQNAGNDFLMGELTGSRPGTANTSLRRTLQSMYQAHQALMHEAEQLRSIFPQGLSMRDFVGRARQNNNTAGAPEVLNFLRNHMAKLTSELSGQPGAPAKEKEAKVKEEKQASAERTRPELAAGASRPERSQPIVAAPSQQPDLLQSVADAVRSLRLLSERKWKDDAMLQVGTQQLADVMHLYVDEVRRLQGKPPIASNSPQQADMGLQEDLDKALTESKKLQSAAKAAQSDLASSQADLQAAKQDLNASRTDLTAAQKELTDWRRKAESLEEKESQLKTQLATLNQQLRDAMAAAPAAKDAPQADTTAAAAPPASDPNAPPEGTMPWKVVVHTSDVSGGAFDGDVYIVLNGSGYKSSGELKLPSDRYNFDCGQADVFTIHVPTDYMSPTDEVFGVGLRMGYSEAGDVTWHVAKVEVSPPAPSPGSPALPTKSFQFNDWLKAGPLNMLFPKASRTAETVEYEVIVRTGDYRGASADGQVYITLVGDQGAASEVLLEPKLLKTGSDASRMLCRGTGDTFVVRAADVGDLSNVVVRIVGADGSAKTCSWAFEDMRVIHAGTGMGSTFYFYDWLSTDAPRATLNEAYTWQAWSQYSIKTLTSSLPGADFEGAVYLTLHGDRGDSSEMLLVSKPAKTQHSFQCGAADTFKLRGDDVGPLTSITLRIAPTSDDNLTWNVQQLSITNEDSGDAAVFNPDAWLTGATSANFYKDTPQVQYKVTLITAADSAPFSGAVYATFNGPYGSSSEVQLVNSSCKGGNENIAQFEPSATQEFEVKERDVGGIQSMQLRVAPMASRAAAGEAWKLDQVKVVVSGSDKELKLTATDAMQCTAADGRSLTLQRSLPMVEYRVQVFTCECPDDSGFDGQVYIKIKGSDGASEDVQLMAPVPSNNASGTPADANSTAANAFGLNANTTFVIQAADVGAMSNLEVSLKQTGSATWWRPNRLEVTNTVSNQTAVFKYNCWMNTWNDRYYLEQQSMMTYQVTVHTSAASVALATGGKPASFSGKLFIKLWNWNYESDEVEVPLDGPLAPGSTAVLPAFKCRVPYINNASVRVDGSTAVHVRMLEVLTEGSDPANATFLPCNQWLGTGYSASATLDSYSMTKYKLSVYTGRSKSAALPAGTSFFLTPLFASGDMASKEEIEVKVPEGGCPVGSSTEIELSTFSFTTGQCDQLRVRVEGASGTWALQRLSLSEANNSYTAPVVFVNSAGKLAIPSTGLLKKTDLLQYSISVTTSELRGADSDGVVMLRLIGEQGETEDLRMSLDDSALTIWSGSALNQGTTDTYTVQAVDVGAIKQVVVYLLPYYSWNDAARSRWHLSELCVTHGGTGVKSHFPYNNWVAPGAEITMDAKDTEQTYVDYTITLSTAYQFCNGDVYVTLSNNYLKSSQITLRSTEAVREGPVSVPGMSDLYLQTFAVRAVSMYDVTSLTVQLSPSSSDSCLYLRRVNVTNKDNQRGALFKMDYAYLYNWSSSPETYTATPSDIYYSAVVRTKNFPDAGWEEMMYLTLHGDQADAPQQCFEYYSFSPDGNTYLYWYGPDVGSLQAVTVRLEGKGKKWSPDYIQVSNYTKNTNTFFEATTDVLPGVDKRVRIPKRVTTTQYQFTTTTTSLRGAGTDGCLYVQLEGETGITEEIKLYESPEDLARDTTHTFKLSSTDVGEVRTLYVRLGAPNGDTVHSAWYGSKIEVLNLTSGLNCVFNVGKWISMDDYTVALPQSSSEQVLQSYRVQVTTSSLREASFDGKAYLQLNGWYGSTDELALVAANRSTASFSAGSTQEFTLRAKDIGYYISSVSLRMVPTVSDPKWHVEKVVVLSDDPNKRPTFEFYHNNWLTQDCAQATLCSTSAPAKYHIMLATAAANTASTGTDGSAATTTPANAWDGQVFITFNGQWSSSAETELVNDNLALQPGSAQEYDIDSTNLGTLSSVSLRLAGGSEGRSLSLERIEVTDKDTGRRMEFVYKEPITTSSGAVTAPILLKETDYKVAIITNADAGNATPYDGDIFVTLYGMDGSSNELKLSAPSSDPASAASSTSNTPPSGTDGGSNAAGSTAPTAVFVAKPALTDGSTVVLQARGADVGPLRYLNLRFAMENTTCTQYLVSALELTHVASGATTRLSCGSTLTSYYNSTYVYPSSSTTYRVRVTTGASDGAQPFDGNVYLRLSSWWNNGKEVLLQNEKGADAFKPGAVEEFTVTCSDISYVSQAVVRIEATGSVKKWQLGLLELWDTSCTTATPSGYLYNDWLVADSETAQVTLSSSGTYTYEKSELMMASDSGPFNGSIWLTAIDTSGRASNEVQLLAAGSQVLASDASCSLGSLPSIYASSYPASVVLRCADNTSSTQPWKPSVLTLTYGSLYRFEAAASEQGVTGAGSVTLTRVPDVEYEVVTVGADLPGNGTDGYIYAVIEGQKGCSQELYLYGDHERAGTDTSSYNVPDLGALKRITLENRDGGSGLHSQWCVSELRVTHLSTGQRTIFDCGSGTWIERSGKAEFATSKVTNIFTAYKVTVYTSSGANSGFDGNVRFKLESTDGRQSAPVNLAKGNLEAGPFKTGGKDEFTVNAMAFDDLQCARFDLDYSGSTSCWTIARVLIERSDTGASWQFTPTSALYSYNWFPAVERTPMVSYEVQLYTTTLDKATYDGSVYLTLTGEGGEGRELQLSLNGGDLSPGNTCYTYLSTYDAGQLKALHVRTDGGTASRWPLGWIKVTNPNTGAMAMFEVPQQATIKAGSSVVLPRVIATVTYEVKVYTMDETGAGTDGDVFIRLCGPNGHTDEMLLRNDDSNLFQRGACNTFSFSGPDVGDSPTAELRLASPSAEGSQVHSGWALDKVEVLNQGSGLKGTYPYATWLNMPSACAVLQQASSQQALCVYTVKVTTGSLPGAGFDGNVWLAMSGWWGDVSEVKLASAGQTTAHLKDGETTEFEVRGIDIGRVTTLMLRIEPTEEDPAWMLDNISVHNTGSDYTSQFYYNSWLNTTNKELNIYANNPRVQYKVVVVTSDQADAGFDGEVYLKLSGTDGQTDELQLLSGSDSSAEASPFLPGSTRECLLRAADVASLRTATLRIVANKKEKKWHLDRLEVVLVPSDGSEAGPVSVFNHRNWVDDSASVELARQLATADYRITLDTTDQPDAGFDGDVYVTLHGSDGDTAELKLDLSATPATNTASNGDAVATTASAATAAATVAAGSTPAAAATADTAAAPVAAVAQPRLAPGGSITVPLTASDVGQISRVDVRIVSSGKEGCSTSWHLATLSVLQVANGALLQFPYRCWVHESSGTQCLYLPSSYTYKVKVYTSAESSDFDGNVLIKLCNYWNSSKEESLAAARTTSGAFKPGSCEEFTVKVEDVGWLSSLQMRVEQSGSGGSRWHCSHVEVISEGGGNTWAFHVHDWMTAQNTESREVSVTNMATCDITLHLSPAEAGSSLQLEDLQLYATLCGKDAEMLSWSEAKLELSPVDTSADAMTAAGGATPYKASVSVPTLPGGGAKLQIRAAAGTSGSVGNWQLSRAQVWDNYNWGNSYFFFGGSLTPAAKLTASSLSMEEYDVTFYTSDVRGNGHDGSVSLVLEGLQYVTDEVYLTSGNWVTAANSSGTTTTMFERGSVDTFTINAASLGKLRNCVLKLAGGHSCWRVDKVEVLQRVSGVLTTFDCQQWLQPYDSSSSSSTLTRLPAPDATTDAQVDWDITIWTAPASDAAFDGEVSLQLFDSKGRSTCMMRLGSGADGLFQVGAKDVLKLRGLALSDLQRAKVRLNNTGSSSTWRCARIQATNTSKGITGMFVYEDLISCWSGDIELSEAPLKSYSVQVYVGEGSQMETEAYLTLHGSEGISKELQLQSWGSWPTYYSEDYRSFYLNAYGLGVLKAITLRTANTQLSSATAPVLSKVVVTVDETSVQSEFNLSKPFPVNDKVTINKKLATTRYQLQVMTSGYRGAGTDADVYVSIKGDDGEIEEFKLNNGPDNFAKDRTDTFTFSNVVVGANKSLTFRLVGADGKPPHSAWNLNWVALMDMNSGDKTSFYQYGWVTADAPTTLKESSTYKGLYPYVIKATTGNAKEAGFEGEVWVKLCGWYGESAEILLAQEGATSHNFMPGAVDSFSIKAEDIGCCTSVQIVRVVPAQGSETAAGWQLESLAVESVDRAETSDFEFSNWITDSSTPLTLYRSGANLPYKVSVFTSSTSTAPAVKQPLLITLKGMLGECDENKLVSESDIPLAPGSKEEFSLKDSDVGPLTQITLAIKQEKEGEQPPSLVCDRVEVLVNDPPTSTALFPCAAAAPAAPTWQLVNGKWTLQLSRQLPDAQYTVAVSTTDVADALFDGDVMVTLNGSDGTTGEVRLPADKPFNPGQKDSFNITAGDIGALTSLSVALKPRTGGSTQWHLSDISVSKGSTGAPFKFTCNSYLNDGNPSVTLYQQGPCKYDVTLITANTPEAAGFVGDVYLSLSGQYGSCQELKLVPANQPALDAPEAMRNAAVKESALEPGNAAAWQLSAPADVGPLTNVTLRVAPADDSKLKKWHCARVVLRSERDPSNPHVLPISDWIQGGKEVTVTARKLIPYSMELTVPDGCEASATPLSLTLLGSDGVTSEEVTVKPPNDTWTAGANTVSFEAMECGILTGMRLTAATPATDSSATTSPVQLQYIKLMDANYGSLLAAFCNPGGGVATLKPGSAPAQLEVLQQVTYTVEVVTGSARGAGTNGSVSITLIGDKGSTGPLSLSNDWYNDFERGRTDSFDVGSVDVGTIRTAKLEVAGAQSGWLLDSVRVTNPGTGLQHTFKHGAWTDMKDQACVLTLTDPSGGKKA